MPNKPNDTRRDKILDTALDLFASKGLQAVSIDEIATKAGVGKATVYRKVGNRDEFIKLLINRAVDIFIQVINESVPANAKPILRFKELISAICDIMQKHHKLMLLIRSQVLLQFQLKGDEGLKQIKHNERVAEAIQIIETIVQDAINSGDFVNYNSKAISKVLIEVLNPYVYKFLTEELGMTKFEIAHFITDLFLNGLRGNK